MFLGVLDVANPLQRRACASVVAMTKGSDSREVNTQVFPHRRNFKLVTLQIQQRSQAAWLKQFWKPHTFKPRGCVLVPVPERRKVRAQLFELGDP